MPSTTRVYNKAVERSELTTNIKYLTGQYGEPDEDDPWRFLLVGQPSETPQDFSSPHFNDRAAGWSEVALPGHWQLQGHDIPIYTNTSYPFAFDPPRARRNGQWKLQDCDVGIGSSSEPSHPNGAKLHEHEPGENPTGLYRRTFSLPSEWKDPASEEIPQGLEPDEFPALPDHRVFMVFEGVTAPSMYVNGVHVGYSQDSCLSAEFEVTDALARRDASQRVHTVAVQVMRWCDGSYLEDQDKWWLSGIYREVYLLRKPATFIADYEFSTELVESDEGDRVDAEYTVHVLVEETYPSQEALAVRAELRRLNPEADAEVDLGEPVSVEVGLMEVNKEMAMRENADGLGTVVSEPGIVEERGFTDKDGDFLATQGSGARRTEIFQHPQSKQMGVEGLYSMRGRSAATTHENMRGETKATHFNVRDAKKRGGGDQWKGLPLLYDMRRPNLYVLILTCTREEARANSYLSSEATPRSWMWNLLCWFSQ